MGDHLMRVISSKSKIDVEEKKKDDSSSSSTRRESIAESPLESNTGSSKESKANSGGEKSDSKPKSTSGDPMGDDKLSSTVENPMKDEKERSTGGGPIEEEKQSSTGEEVNLGIEDAMLVTCDHRKEAHTESPASSWAGARQVPHKVTTALQDKLYSKYDDPKSAGKIETVPRSMFSFTYEKNDSKFDLEGKQTDAYSERQLPNIKPTGRIPVSSQHTKSQSGPKMHPTNDAPKKKSEPTEDNPHQQSYDQLPTSSLVHDGRTSSSDNRRSLVTGLLISDVSRHAGQLFGSGNTDLMGMQPANKEGTQLSNESHSQVEPSLDVILT